MVFGNIKHTGKSCSYTFFYDGTKAKFSGREFASVPLYHCGNLIRNGNFLPDEETFKQLKQMYYTGKDPEGMLDGQDCYIVGGGSSLRGFDYSKLEGKFTISLNHTMHYFESSAVLFIDSKFLKDAKGKARHALNNYNGLIFAAWRSKYHIVPHKSNKVYNFSLNTVGPQDRYYNGLYRGKSSGLCAINLALIMNARRIYLLGFDYDANAPVKHFYNEQGNDMFSNEGSYTEGKCRATSAMYDVFKPYSNRIINCNRDSKIKTFKFGGINESTKNNNTGKGRKQRISRKEQKTLQGDGKDNTSGVL